MALTINRLWTGILLIETLTKALPFAFFKNFNKFFTNLPLPEIILAISTFTIADTNISNWSAFWLYVSQTLYNKVLENATHNDFENFLQKILGIPPSFWEFIVLPILLFLVVCVAIWIALKIIAAIGTIVSKTIQPISIPESLQPICILASEGLGAICTLASEVSKYACILMPVMLVTFSFVLVLLSKFTPIDVDKHVSIIVNFYFTPYKTPEQSMPPSLINGH